ncbi:MAG: zinc-ribbon domain-containing protein [Oscillospiraceae bacterium]|nr:zinc-ribbon domain-containing protein [Oscillospiraceae bacterium]
MCLRDSCPYCGHHLSVPDAPFCSECGKAL